MIVLIANLTVTKENQENLLNEVITKLTETRKKFPGLLKVEVLADEVDLSTTTYTLIEYWESITVHKECFAWLKESGFIGKISKWFAKPLELKYNNYLQTI